MKKFRLFVTLTLVFVLALPLLAGCSLADLFGGNGNNNSTSNSSLMAIDVLGTIKTEYVVGESFDANGAKLKLIYDDRSTLELSLDKSMTNFDSTTVGQKDLIVTYEGKTKTCEYRVDAFRLGTYRQITEFIGSNNYPVTTWNYSQSRMSYIFKKDGTGNVIYGTNGDIDYQNLPFTWQYCKNNTAVTIYLNDSLNQNMELTIDSTIVLHREYDSAGENYVKIRSTLNFYA